MLQWLQETGGLTDGGSSGGMTKGIRWVHGEIQRSIRFGQPISDHQRIIMIFYGGENAGDDGSAITIVCKAVKLHTRFWYGRKNSDGNEPNNEDGDNGFQNPEPSSVLLKMRWNERLHTLLSVFFRAF